MAFSYTVVPTGGPPEILAVIPNPSLKLVTSAPSTFQAISTGSPTTWNWDFDGGADPPTSALAQPSVTLGLPGSYAATVSVSNAAGSSSPFPFTLEILPHPRVTALTSPPNLFAPAGAPFPVVAATQGTIDSWDWNFGAGIPHVSTEASPQVQFNSSGRYSVEVRVRGPEGVALPYDFTLVIGPQIPRLSSIGHNPNRPTVGESVQFFFSSPTPVSSVLWTFNGGVNPTTSGSRSPFLGVTTAGNFSGTLTLTNRSGSVDFPFDYSIWPTGG